MKLSLTLTLKPAQIWRKWHDMPALRGKKLGFVLVGWGMVAVLALPPFGITPFLCLALVGLLWQLRAATTYKSAFLMGWQFGFGFFLAGLYWIANALFVDFAQFWWIYPFALVGLPLFLALFIGGVTISWYGFARKRRISLKNQESPANQEKTDKISENLPLDLANLLIFALLWSVAEYLRGHILTGLPWNLVAYSWSHVLVMSQAAAWVGAYGVSLLTMLVCVLPAGWYQRGGKLTCFIGAVGLCVWAAAGAWRVYGSDLVTRPEPVTLRLVQPNIPQILKLDAQFDAATVEHLLALSTINSSKLPPNASVNAIIWPEAATNYVLENEPNWRKIISQALPKNTSLITGTIRVTPPQQNQAINPALRPMLTNGLIALSSDNQILAHYDKAHLVPFGEYMPGRGLIPMPQAIANNLDFTAGRGPQAIKIPGLPSFSPLICYEAIFPGQVMPPPSAAPDARPQFLLSIANDSWYGMSTGPYQHFTQSLWRGIEEGLPVIRVSNNGISGVGDVFGRVTQSLGLDQSGVLDIQLPDALAHSDKFPTLYARFGDWGFFILSLIVLLGTLSNIIYKTLYWLSRYLMIYTTMNCHHIYQSIISSNQESHHDQCNQSFKEKGT
ncbi:MAG: apolipoprotein N-acyltransferase [Alphaproteobacteria bacterium]|nr:apolipoprotein N-acyltransferase [Alphaproteobacteria bacterium]